MTAVHLDTHVVLWIFDSLTEKIEPALRHLEGQKVVISPAAYLELEFLCEVGRSMVPAPVILNGLAETIGLVLAKSPWDEVVRTALTLNWTLDPFDRLIAAHAITDEARW